jgi:hypothetical protein
VHRRPKARRAPLTASLAHYLASGCWRGDEDLPEVDFEVFALAGHVLRGHHDELADLWAEHGAEVRRLAAPGARLFAEARLAGGAATPDCPDHWPPAVAAGDLDDDEEEG